MNDDLPPGFEEFFSQYRAKPKDGNGAKPGAREEFSAAELKDRTFPPVRMVVPGLFVEGLTLLAGKPKIGKSFLALQVALAVAQGLPTLGGALACEAGDVLYCALEDTEPRLQRRIEKLGMGWPSELDMRVELPRLTAGGLAKIANWIEHAGKPRLVIVDTLELIRDPRKAADNGYAGDYAAVLALRNLANAHNVAIVVVHHLRKAEAEDPFDTVSGTLGLTGAPDAILIIARNSAGYTLHGRGRDLLEIEQPVVFDKESCLWSLRGAGPTSSGDPWRKSKFTLLRRVLENGLADHGVNLRPWVDGPLVRAVDQELLRFEFYKQHPAPEAENAGQRSQARQRAFRRAIDHAVADGLVVSMEIDGKVMLWKA